MQVLWFIQVVRVLFMALCLYIGVVVSPGFGGSKLTGAIGGIAFGGFLVLLDSALGRVSVRHFSHAVFGLLAGLFGAFLITRVGLLQMGWLTSLPDGETIRNAIELVVFLAFTLAVRSDRDQFAMLIPYVRFRRDASEGEPLLLDTNIVIDGRIPKLCETGFLTGTMVIPRLVLDELQRLADSQESLKAERGKRGLLVLEQMRAMRDLDLTIHEDGTSGTVPVDTRLANLARELNARLLTNDENLAQVARLRGVAVLSLNELSRALQSELTAGDQIEIALVKTGREKHQGVGYLPDGAMVIVNNAVSFVGNSVRVIISGTTQTSAGRLIFAELQP